ncbi:MAG: transcription elongation factor GreB [Gammaproteobacteria bacterium]|nr:transcription elongation factor GreB [Gammaproteobacteria bacterium]MDH5801716.1 transcription elongation factor GreB [Gammaproteobacteria bacterium]
MGRYRPPQKPGSKYITPEGMKRLSDELDFLWKKKRPEVTQALSAAAAEGDRSENAEYIYRKKQLREIDSRVRFLRKRLENMTVVSQKPSDLNRVFFGAWVTLEDDLGEEARYRLVGPDEFDYKNNLISMDSPMGKALMGKTLDADVMVATPKGDREYIITRIEYD